MRATSVLSWCAVIVAANWLLASGRRGLEAEVDELTGSVAGLSDAWERTRTTSRARGRLRELVVLAAPQLSDASGIGAIRNHLIAAERGLAIDRHVARVPPRGVDSPDGLGGSRGYRRI